MKYVWRLAFVGVFLAPIARAEMTVVKKVKTAQLQSLENLDKKIASLENYTVVYKEPGKKTYLVMKSAPARQSETQDNLSVELRPAKRKS